MPVIVRIPTPLRTLTKGKDMVEATGKDLREVLTDLDKSYPGLKERICDETGSLRRFVNIYVNDEDSRLLQDLETPIKDGDTVSIIPAVAGG